MHTAKEVVLAEDGIHLRWDDGHLGFYPYRRLRAECRCAACVNEFTGERTVDRAQIPADIMAEEVRTVGNYAVAIKWSDGHSTGLYPYRSIEQLAASATSTAGVSG